MGTEFLAMTGLTVVGVFLFFAAKGTRAQSTGNWELDWLSPPLNPNAQNSQVNGEWSGSFSYRDISLSSIKHEDGSFKATICEIDGAIAGEIEDELGRAELMGYIDFPDVRFKKRYHSSKNASWTVGDKLGAIYYEGKLSPDGKSMTGDWFQNPINPSGYCGIWKMNLLKSHKREEPKVDTPLQETKVKQKKSHPQALKEEVKEDQPLPLLRGKHLGRQAHQESKEKPETDPKSTDHIVEKAPTAPQLVIADANYSAPGYLKCPHCNCETSDSFQFCLYCSGTLN